MKRNALASALLAFATAFVLADNLGTTSLVGDLSSTSDYVYTADQADTVFATRVPTNRTINGHALTANVTIGASDIRYSNDLDVGEAIGMAWSTASAGVHTVKFGSQGSNLNNDGTVTIPLADTEGPGVVQLSASTNGTSTTKAATESAVKDAIAAAKSYADAKAASVAYTHPSYTARTGKPTANASPTWGGTFTVSQIKSDATGHVTDAVDRTITIPSAAATTSAAGLMSAADKTALDSLSSGAVLKTTVSAALTAQGISSADDIDTLNETIAELKKVIAVLEALD